jgi:hypothetical protein
MGGHPSLCQASSVNWMSSQLAPQKLVNLLNYNNKDIGKALRDWPVPVEVPRTGGDGVQQRNSLRIGSMESGLLSILNKDFGDGVFTYLCPRTAARLECTFTSDLVFIPLGGVQALLQSVARRRHAEATEAGATLGVLGEGGAGHVGEGAAVDIHGDGAGAGRGGEEDDQRWREALPGDVG